MTPPQKAIVQLLLIAAIGMFVAALLLVIWTADNVSTVEGLSLTAIVTLVVAAFSAAPWDFS